MMVTNKMSAEIQPMSSAGLALRFLGASLGAIFSAGAATGVVAAISEHQTYKSGAFVALTLFVLLAAGCGWYAWKTGKRYLRENAPVSPRVRRASIALAIMFAIGILAGVLVPMSSGQSAHQIDLFKGPLPPELAAILIGVILLGAVPVTWYWHRNIDEHEDQAYRAGALGALYFYSAVAPVWWIGHRGGLLPQPDGIAIYLGTMLVWMAIHLRRRFA